MEAGFIVQEVDTISMISGEISCEFLSPCKTQICNAIRKYTDH